MRYAKVHVVCCITSRNSPRVKRSMVWQNGVELSLLHLANALLFNTDQTSKPNQIQQEHNQIQWRQQNKQRIMSIKHKPIQHFAVWNWIWNDYIAGSNSEIEECNLPITEPPNHSLQQVTLYSHLGFVIEVSMSREISSVKRDGVDAGWTQNGALRDTRSNWAQIRRYPVYKRMLKWHHWYHTNQQMLTWDAVKWFDDYSVNCKGLRASFYNCATAFRPASLLLCKYSLIPVDNSATAVKAM